MYPKDTEKWKQFTTNLPLVAWAPTLFCIPKILKNESNSQLYRAFILSNTCCFVSQRYWKMKAIHNVLCIVLSLCFVVLYPKDTEKWKQFTTYKNAIRRLCVLFCIPKILKNESNSQLEVKNTTLQNRCFVSQRYWKMKAIHNKKTKQLMKQFVVLYPKDTEKWKQFTTPLALWYAVFLLFCIPKILKNESNSQRYTFAKWLKWSCFVSQRYWKMKAIHNRRLQVVLSIDVVLYPKDTEKWKQFTTVDVVDVNTIGLFCIPKILKNESNSQQLTVYFFFYFCCFVSQRYWKMKAIHNGQLDAQIKTFVVLYPKDTEKWKQFTTGNLLTILK